MKEKVIGYARKSIYVRGYESEREGVQYQLTRIQEYAEENEFELIEFFSDIGYSGVLKSRPELNRMLSLIKNNEEKVKALILYSQDRLVRDLSTSIELMLEIMDYVDEIIFAVENERKTGIKFIESFLVKAAQYAEERRLLKARLQWGRNVKVTESNLYRSTYKPLGYLQKKKHDLVLATSTNSTDLKLNNDFTIIQYIFLSYLSRMNLRQIASKLNEYFGLTKRGKHWDHTAVREILKNPVYAGMLSGIFDEEGLIGPVKSIEPLISLPLYHYIQLKLEAEKPGNKPKRSNMFPEISLCLKCFKPLDYMNNQFQCVECQASISIDTYIELIRQEFTHLLNGQQLKRNYRQLLNEKQKQMSIQLYRLQEKLQTLKDREEEVLVEFRDSKEKQDRLLELNLIQQKEVQKDLKLGVAFYQSLFGPYASMSIKDLSPTEPVIVMPYCVLVDFQEATLYVKYHESIFEEVKNNDPFSLQILTKENHVWENIK
ncbi:recombinase family protein [Bacillus salitolerans]|uniref:Recombinase family protein n=1 Tax=Bacillus salitolerans TaxID=1437434 RepID=A0ABW4LR40_9BACI